VVAPVAPTPPAAPPPAAPQQFAAAAQLSPPNPQRCRVPPIYGTSSGGGAATTMQVVNDGRGDCGVFLWRDPATQLAYNRIFLTTPPANGTVTVDGSRVAYTPRPGFTGSDQFIVSTSPPGSETFNVTVLPGR
jgi:Bacterial Ig domain